MGFNLHAPSAETIFQFATSRIGSGCDRRGANLYACWDIAQAGLKRSPVFCDTELSKLGADVLPEEPSQPWKQYSTVMMKDLNNPTGSVLNNKEIVMGYEAYGDGPFHVKKENFDQCVAILNKQSDLIGKTMESVLEKIGFECDFDPKSGDLITLVYPYQKLCDADSTLIAIAEFVESGEITWCGEEESHWKHVFENKTVRILNGRIVYEEQEIVMPKREVIGSICSHGGEIFYCKCDVKVGEDGETAWIDFPQLAKDTDNLSPMVYATMEGTQLVIRLCGREDIALEFAWDEGMDKWVQQETK